MKLVFTSFKTKNHFSYKDPIPDDLKSLLVYKFTCASCSCSYIGETCCIFFFFFFFAFLFHLLSSLSLTLTISVFYCLNYTSLLLHLMSTHLVSHLSLSSIIFSISTLTIGNFYCLNYISLLLHLIITHLVNMS